MANVATARVYYDDTDSGGVAYYATYLRWFEIGRVELLREKGITRETLEREGLILPVVDVRCQYKHPAALDDEIEIRTDIERLGNSSITFSYRILRRHDKTLLAEGSTVNVLVKDNMSFPIPEDIRRRLGKG